MLEHWLWYAERKMSCHQKKCLLEHFRDPEELYRATEPALRQVEGLDERACSSLLDKDLTEARQLVNRCRRTHVQVLTYGDAQYPDRLRGIYDAPVVLYYQGILPAWNDMPFIGIVGTRQATAYGCEVAATLSAQIVDCGGAVISGGALGIDTVSMQAALEAGGTVVAVLAGGLDKYYPAANTSLFHKICAAGCLISEYPPGTASISRNFPARNRLITGIANGLLVVEAPLKSGAMISARHAIEQGREVFSVPGSVTMPTCAGTNALLQEGARAVLTGWDVVKEYEYLYPHTIQRRERPSPAERPQPKLAQQTQRPKIADKNPIDNRVESPYSVVHTEKPTLTEQEQKLIACIGSAGGWTDEIIALSGLNAAEAKKLLTRLALKNRLVLHPGGRVTLK